MVTRASIQEFLDRKKIAIIGVSRNPKEFANTVFRSMKTRGYTVYPINPLTERIEGDRCYPNIKSLPEQVDGVLIMLPREKTIEVLPEISESGIKHVWIQQHTESPLAIQFCIDHKIKLIYGECIMMYAEPLGFPHKVHRWVKKITGALPQ